MRPGSACRRRSRSHDRRRRIRRQRLRDARAARDPARPGALPRDRSPQPGLHGAHDPRHRAAGDRGVGLRRPGRPHVHDRIGPKRPNRPPERPQAGQNPSGLPKTPLPPAAWKLLAGRVRRGNKRPVPGQGGPPADLDRLRSRVAGSAGDRAHRVRGLLLARTGCGGGAQRDRRSLGAHHGLADAS